MKRYSSATSWNEPRRTIWTVLADVERFLLDRLTSDRGTQREIDARDENGDISATSVSAARERIEQENTELKILTLSVWTGPERAFEGLSEMAAIVRVQRSMDSFDVEIRFSALNDAVARRLKLDFDAWHERRSTSLGEAERIGATPFQAMAGDRPLSVSTLWWKPDFRNVRDNLVADVIWVLLVAIVVAAIGLIGYRRLGSNRQRTWEFVLADAGEAQCINVSGEPGGPPLLLDPNGLRGLAPICGGSTHSFSCRSSASDGTPWLRLAGTNYWLPESTLRPRAGSSAHGLPAC